MNPRSCFLPLLALLLWRSVMAHPAHVSMTEMEWDPAAGRFEIGLKMAPEDLGLALSRFTGERVSLHNTEQLDRLLRELIMARFTIKPATGQPLILNWIGHEISHQAAWLYFELRPGPGQKDFVLSNRLLLEARPQQVNTVNFKFGKQRQTFRFSRDNVEARLLLPHAPGNE